MTGLAVLLARLLFGALTLAGVALAFYGREIQGSTVLMLLGLGGAAIGALGLAWTLD